MQRNFILTDVMRTGFHNDLEQFIDMHTMPDQSIEHTCNWYTLHDFDLDSYDRKLAIIDISQGNYQVKDSKEFMDDNERLTIISAIKYVDKALISKDQDKTQRTTL